MYVYMYVCMYMCVCMCVCVCVCVRACMRVCVYACMRVCMYACMYVCMSVSMRLCVRHIILRDCVRGISVLWIVVFNQIRMHALCSVRNTMDLQQSMEIHKCLNYD